MKHLKYLLFFVVLTACAGNQTIAQENTKLFVSAPSGLKLRATPNLSAKVVGVGAYGQAVQLLEKNVSSEQTIEGVSGYWYLVELEGKEGFMFSGFLKGGQLSKENLEKEVKKETEKEKEIEFQIAQEIPIEENLIIKNILVDIETNKILRYYEEQKGFSISEGDKYGGDKIPIIISGLITETGKKIALERYEEVVGFNNNKIITNYKNWEENTTELRLYDLVNNFIELIKTVVIKSTAHIYSVVLENNIILAWDENEEFGHSYALYDFGLEELSVTTPFKNGFNHFMHFATSEITVVLTKSYTEGSKVYSYNKEGILIDDISLNLEDIRPWNIFASKQKYIIYGFSQGKKQPVLRAMDRNNKHLWEKELVLPYHYRDFNFEVDQDGQYALAFTGKFKSNILQISLLDLDSGNSVWDKRLTDIVKLSESKNKFVEKIGLRPAALEILNNNKYFFVIGEMAIPSAQNKLVKFYNSTAFWVNQPGQFQQISNLSSFQCLKLIRESETLMVSDNKILSNEK